MRSNKKNFKFLLSNLEYSAAKYDNAQWNRKKTAAYFWLELSHKKKLREKSPKFKCPAPSKEPVKKGQGQNTLLYQLKTFCCDPEYISATGKRYYFIPTVLEPCQNVLLYRGERKEIIMNIICSCSQTLLTYAARGEFRKRTLKRS